MYNTQYYTINYAILHTILYIQTPYIYTIYTSHTHYIYANTVIIYNTMHTIYNKLYLALLAIYMLYTHSIYYTPYYTLR
jgi:hypothetical protein